MSKSAMIRARVDPGLKEDAESVFAALGLSVTQAITLFYLQVKWYRGLPFELRLPNEATQQVFAQTDAGEDLERCKDVKDMFRRLGI